MTIVANEAQLLPDVPKQPKEPEKQVERPKPAIKKNDVPQFQNFVKKRKPK